MAMTLEKPAGTASKLGTYELLKEQPGIGVGSTWIARSAGDGGESPALFSVIRVHKHLVKKPETALAVVADTASTQGFEDFNVATLTEVGTEGGELYVVSAHHHGETLGALVTAAGAQGLAAPIALRIAIDVLSGLAAAHGHEPPLTHGELGPHQVIVGDDGVARVTGLSSARALSRVTPAIGAKNHDRLAYAAPERVKTLSSTTPSPAEPRADVFSVGVILWESLAKQRLFTSKIEAAIIQKVLTAPIAALGTVAGVTVEAPLAEAVQQALERDPAKRTQTAAELMATLEALGPDAIATAAQVAAEVERLAGKAIATRKADLRAEIARRASKGSSTIPPPALNKPGAFSARKATLLGIPSVKAGAPPSDGGARPAPAIPPPPIEVKHAIRPPAESLDLEDIEVAAASVIPSPPRPPPQAAKRGVTLLMGSVNAPGAASPPDDPAALPKPPKPATALKPAQALLDQGTGGTAGTGKTAPTPASDGPSPRSKQGVAVEKVGPGSTLGRYEILMPVARGGMASVWAAKLPGTRGFQKIFAIKTMLPDVSDDPDFESMFLDEGRVAARIRHPNVVEIIDLGEQDDVLYLVMEWVEGENLGALVKAARSLGGVPMPIILRIASQVCAGLHAAHELRDDDGNLLDLVHRDISPANVLLSASGFVKIVDFGIAKSKGRLHVTRVGGMVKGKTPYLSPEQLGQQPVDRRSDIFSFGVLLYVLATGLHPFRGETDSKTIENIALREPVPLRAIVANTPAEFEAVVLKALSKDPRERFGTAGEMQRALDHVAASLGFTTTEEDVAAFVRKALGETFTKRAHDLRAAIERADGRTPPPPSRGREGVRRSPSRPCRPRRRGHGRHAGDRGGRVGRACPGVAEAARRRGAAPGKPPAAKREPISAGFTKPKPTDAVTLPEITDLEPAPVGRPDGGSRPRRRRRPIGSRSPRSSSRT